jgi:hypothetical protein
MASSTDVRRRAGQIEERSLQESTTVTVEGDSWIHASSGHPASEVDRDKHKVERETKKVNERDKKEIEYDQTDTLGWTTNKAGTSSITAALDQGQLEAVADDDRGAGSGGRATAFVADDACFARRGQEDTQQGKQRGRPKW